MRIQSKRVNYWVPEISRVSPILIVGGLLFVFLAPGLAQTTHTWSGAVSSDFTESGNWSAGGVPLAVGSGRISVQNGANNPLYFTEAQGAPIYTGGSANRALFIASGDAGSAMVITGGTFDSRADAPDGISNGVDGFLTIDGGAYINTNGGNSTTFLVKFGGSGTGTLTIDSGSFTTGILQFGDASGGSGVVHLNGGVLTAGQIRKVSNPDATFNFNGGTLVAGAASTTYMQGLNRANVRDDGAVIDTNGYDVTIAQALLHSDIGGDAAIDGGLTKLGDGTLTLSGANMYTGETRVSEGVLRITNANALGTTDGAVTVTSGARLELQGSITVTGETVTIHGNGDNSFGALQNFNGNNTWAGDVVIGSSGARVGANSGTLTISGEIGGDYGLIVRNNGTGRVTVLSGENTYTGATQVVGGVTRIDGGHNRLPTGTVLQLGLAHVSGEFDLNGWNQQVAGLQITQTSGTYDNVITNTGSAASTLTITQNSNQSFSGLITNGTNALNLVKAGGGTLTLSGNNNYTGTTAVSSGVLRISHANALGTTHGAVTVASGARLELAGDITVTGQSITTSGTGGDNNIGGLQSFSGHNTWTGDVTLGANGARIGANGVGQSLTVSGVIGDSGTNRTLGVRNAATGGTTILSGANTYGGGTDVVVGLLQIAGGDNRLPIGTVLQLGNTSNVGSATVDLNGFNQQVAGLIDLGTSMTRTVTNSDNTTLSTLTVNNASADREYRDVITGNLALTKAGAATLTLSGNNTYTGGTTIRGGTLSLDYTTNNTSKLSDTAALVLGGGRLNLTGGSHAEVVAATTLLAHTASSITRTSGSGALQMNTITPGAGATVDFGADGIATTDNLNSHGILGLWATVGGSNWASNSTDAADGPIVAYTAYTDVPYGGTIANGPGSNVRLFGGTSGDVGLGSATTTINTLLQYQDDSVTVDTAGETLRLGANGGVLLPSGKGALTIASGTLTAGGADNTAGTLTLINHSAEDMTVGAIIANNGSGMVGLNKAGEGTLVLTANNSYTGHTRISAGTLQVTGSGRLVNASPVVVAEGATFEISTTAWAYGGNISGEGGFTKSGTAGDLRLTGTSTYTGPTLVTGTGTLRAGSAQAFGIDSALTVASGAVELNRWSLAVGSISGGGTIRNANIFYGPGPNDDLTVLTVGGNGNSTTFSGSLQDGTAGVPLGLTKVGEGTLTLSGTNTYTGTTTISYGTLQVGAGGGAGSLGTGNIVNDAALVVDRTGTLTMDQEISGSGTLTKLGSGTLVLSGDNSYMGDTTVVGGAIRVTGATGLGDTAGITTVEAGARVELSGGVTVSGQTIRIGGDGASGSTGALRTIDGYNVWDGPVFLDGPGGMTGARVGAVNAGSVLEISGVIQNGTQNEVMIRNSDGKVVFSGANEYTGETHIYNGTLALGADNSLPVGNPLRLGIYSLHATFDLGGFNQTIGTLRSDGDQDGSRTITNTGGGASTLVVTQNSDRVFDGVITNGASALNLVKAGGSRLTLTGESDYTGTTTITAGTLALSHGSNSNISGSALVQVGPGATLDVAGLAGGTFALADGQTLGGSGTVAGAVDVLDGATLAPGMSIGTLNLTGDVALYDGAVWDWEFLNNEPDNYDQVSGPTLILPTDSDSLITLNILGLPGHSVNWYDEFVLFTGAVENFDAGLFNLVNDSSWDRGWAISVGNSLILTAVPEPGTWLMLMCVMVCGLLVRRGR